MSLFVLAGGDLVLPDRILANASLIIEDTRIAAIEPTASASVSGATIVDAQDCYVVPGFVDVHVHGVDGIDSLDEGDPIALMASRLPRFGVTAFCPTTVACRPGVLRSVLRNVAQARAMRPSASARVLAAHLESNFINSDYCGAQPPECLRSPALAVRESRESSPDEGDFSGREILDVIADARPDVGIVTLAPELPGGLELIDALVAAGHRVSLGHSGANFDAAMAAIDAGARHATHLFNRMAPMTHRAPGVAGAVLAREEVAAEIICDGYHVHPAMSRVAILSKGTDRIMAITDGTAGSGLPVGSYARLGGQQIRVTESAAVLGDGTLAGSTLTMDGAFRTIVTAFGLSVVDAAIMCSTTPARELGLTGFGVLAPGAAADIVVIDRGFRVVRTFIDGRDACARAE